MPVSYAPSDSPDVGDDVFLWYHRGSILLRVLGDLSLHSLAVVGDGINNTRLIRIRPLTYRLKDPRIHRLRTTEAAIIPVQSSGQNTPLILLRISGKIQSFSQYV